MTEVEQKRTAKSTYMLTRPWYCNVCKNEKNYTLAGKWSHIKCKKHQEIINPQKFWCTTKWACTICNDGERDIDDVFRHTASELHKNNIHKGDWYCDICNNGKNYKCIGEKQHKATKGHKKRNFIFFVNKE